MDFEKALAPLNELNQQQQNTPAAPAEGQQNNGTPPEGAQPPAGAPPAADNNQQSQQQTNTPPAGSPPAAPTINYAEYLDRMSGGLIKDEDSFKLVIPQLQEYPTLKQKFDELSSQLEKAPKFANDEVRIYNELVASGASREQLDSFQKINAVGELKDLTPYEARIARMVLVDGVKPSVAKLKVDREFKIGDDYAGIDPTEREILDEDLRVAANKDREELAKFKAQVSDTGKVAPEELALQQQANIQQHTAQVKPYVKSLVTDLPHLGQFTLIEKDDAKGIDGVAYEVPMTEAYRTELNQYVENFFMDGLTPITKENTITALAYARAELFRNHAGEIFKEFYDTMVPQVEQRIINKYENRSGLKPAVDNPNPGANPASEMAGFMKQVAERKVGG